MSFVIWSRPADYHEDGRVEKFEQFRDAMNYLEEQIATWNNFTPDVPLEIKIEKPVPENTLGIVVADETQTTENLS